MESPTNSPDLNPIEVVWNDLKIFCAEFKLIFKTISIKFVRSVFNLCIGIKSCSCEFHFPLVNGI